jgi:hypothetical protein
MEIKKWKYQTELVRGDAHMEQMLTHCGEEGWELVAVLPKKSNPGQGDPKAESWTLIFKQPKP